jgi:phage-related minor tail protein
VTDTNAALTDVFTQIQNAPDDLAAGQIAIDTFGSRAGPALAESIRTGKLSYEDMLATIQDGTGTILGTADATNDWREKLQILKNRISVDLLPVATYLFAQLSVGLDMIEKLADKFDRLAKVFDKLSPNTKKWLGLLILALAAIGPILLGIGFLLPVITAVGAALGLLSIPLLLIIALIALFALAWFKNWGDIQGKTAR